MFVILSEAKNLVLGSYWETLRFTQGDMRDVLLKCIKIIKIILTKQAIPLTI